METARIAPTAANFQPQRLIVIQESKGLELLKKAANIYDVPLAILVCADHNCSWKRSFDGKDTADIDTAIVTDHMVLKATELGLGTIGICDFKPEVIKKDFNLPNNLEPIIILGIGYSA